MTRVQTWTMIAALTLATTPAGAGEGPTNLETAIAELGPGVRVGIEVERQAGDGSPAASFRKDADAVLPTASSIKVAIMIEMFAEFAGKLDEPAPGLADILRDDHPAVSHFGPGQRDEIRAGLSGATVRRIGRVMLGAENATNLVYNAASNAAIALLGGPEETSRRIHARAPEFGAIMVRRYMLADRNVRGDNESTAAALAAVLRRLADRALPGLDEATVEACRTTVEVSDDPARGRRRFKDGALDTLPIARVATGWYETPGKPAAIYVVMLAQDDPGSTPAAEAADRLQKAAERLATIAVDALSAP